MKRIKKYDWLVIITAFYIAGCVLQNILAVKTFGTSLLAITTAGTLISWLVFGCIDLLTEVWGKGRARKTFIGGAIMNIFFNIVCWIAILIPGTNEFVGNAYSTVLGTSWRIATASIIAFLMGNFIDTHIMHKMRVNSKDEHKTKGFVIRATVSTLFGQLADNAIFYILAFAPIGIVGTVESPWIMIGELVLFTTIFETVVEAIFSPFIGKFAEYLKHKEDK